MKSGVEYKGKPMAPAKPRNTATLVYSDSEGARVIKHGHLCEHAPNQIMHVDEYGFYRIVDLRTHVVSKCVGATSHPTGRFVSLEAVAA